MDNRLLFPAVVAAALLGWLIAMVFGDVTWLNETAELLKSIFLSALRAIVAPLIFFSLISGILRLGDTTELGRIGGTTVLYYLARIDQCVLDSSMDLYRSRDGFTNCRY